MQQCEMEKVNPSNFFFESVDSVGRVSAFMHEVSLKTKLQKMNITRNALLRDKSGHAGHDLCSFFSHGEIIDE